MAEDASSRQSAEIWAVFIARDCRHIGRAMSDAGPAGRFAGKVAVITAGGAGIGAATAARFARDGAGVIVGDISGRRAAAVAEEIT
jgi:3-oxoacyl-ACP reductase-like protein